MMQNLANSANTPATATAAGGPSSCFIRFLVVRTGPLRARNCRAITWGRHIDPSRCALRNNLDHDIYRRLATLVTHQVYVPAAYVGEAVACSVDLGRAGGVGGVVNRERSRCNRDQAGTRMRVPHTVSPGWERVLDYIDVRISLHHHLEVPPVRVELIAHQVEQARRVVAQRQRYGRQHPT